MGSANKKCSMCNVEKPLSDFRLRKDTGNYRSYCLMCERDWKKQHYNSNKQEILGKQKQYSLLNRAEIKVRSKLYRDSNKEKLKAQRAIRYPKHKAKRLAYIKQWQQKNITKVRKYKSKHAKSNASYYRLIVCERRSILKSSKPPWLTKADRELIDSIYREAQERTAKEGVAYHVDHIVPLRGKEVCGLHVPWNLQVIPASDNIKKSNRLTLDNE